MNKDETSFEELMTLEGRLRRAEATGGEQESLGRVLVKVQGHANSAPGSFSRRWGRRVSMFAVVGIPAAGALAIAGILLLNANSHRPILPGASSTPSIEPTSAPSASASTPSAEPLVVVTQRLSAPQAVKGAQDSVTLGQAPDTVLLARPDGTVVARATFKPAERPLITNAATIFPPQVHAAAGAAYYIDGDGVVRRLDRDGKTTRVATFTTSEPQHMTSFAVSPDGSRVMASVFTFGARGPGLPGAITVGPSYANLEYAEAGGPTRILSHVALASTLGHFMVVGWDDRGPVAGTAVLIATQNLAPAGWESPVYSVDLAGNITGRLAGNCTASMEVAGGRFLCGGSAFAGTAATVNSEDGSVLWTLPATAVSWESAVLSPSADIVALKPMGSPSYHNHLDYRNGAQLPLPDDFRSIGWLGDGTLFGYQGDLNTSHLYTITLTSGQVRPAQQFPVDSAFAGTIGP
jgi:hypothetical protein